MVWGGAVITYPTKRVFRDGFAWEVPETDLLCFDAIYWDSQLIKLVNQYCARFRVAVQAGGNVGVYPLGLLENFRRVFTFEPAKDNFYCLRTNIEKRGYKADGVFAFNVALSDTIGESSLELVEPHNCGTYRLAAAPSLSVTPTVTIDQFHLTDCDLIWLDIEGAELKALKGAYKTIHRCRPVIALEVKDHCENYGYTRSEMCHWILGQGYVQVGEVKDDYIFAPKEQQQ